MTRSKWVGAAWMLLAVGWLARSWIEDDKIATTNALVCLVAAMVVVRW